MAEALERVLQLVAEGRLTAEEAEPILAALAGDGARTSGSETGRSRDRFDERAGPFGDPAPGAGRPTGDARNRGGQAGAAPGGPRFLRVRVTERGHDVVNLRVPLALGRFAVTRVPGLSDATGERVRRAIELGLSGPIIEAVEADGSGVRIVIE